MPTKQITGSIVIRYTQNAVLTQLPEKSHAIRHALAKLITENGRSFDKSLPTCLVELRCRPIDEKEYQYDDIVIEVEVDSYDGMIDDKSVAKQLLCAWTEIFIGNTSIGIRMKYRDSTYISSNFKS